MVGLAPFAPRSRRRGRRHDGAPRATRVDRRRAAPATLSHAIVAGLLRATSVSTGSRHRLDGDGRRSQAIAGPRGRPRDRGRQRPRAELARRCGRDGRSGRRSRGAISGDANRRSRCAAFFARRRGWACTCPLRVAGRGAAPGGRPRSTRWLRKTSAEGDHAAADDRNQVPLRAPREASVLYLSVVDYPSGWRIAAPSRTLIPELRQRWPSLTAIELSDRARGGDRAGARLRRAVRRDRRRGLRSRRVGEWPPGSAGAAREAPDRSRAPPRGRPNRW